MIRSLVGNLRNRTIKEIHRKDKIAKINVKTVLPLQTCESEK